MWSPPPGYVTFLTEGPVGKRTNPVLLELGHRAQYDGHGVQFRCMSYITAEPVRPAPKSKTKCIDSDDRARGPAQTVARVSLPGGTVLTLISM